MNTNIIEDNIENNIKIKRTRNRLTKKEQFTAERQEIINKLNNIIGIDDVNNNVSLNSLESNILLKNKLEELIPQIKKIYRSCTWGYFISEKNAKGSGNLITLLKSVYTNSNYSIYSKQKIFNKHGEKNRQTFYYFEKKIL